MNGPDLDQWLARVADAHRALDDHLTAAAETDASAPSLLPGWSRGHVITHIARNADSFVRVLSAAERGEAVSQYEGGVDGRNAEIEAGAGREWADLADDVRTASVALEAVFAEQQRWDLAMVNSSGESVSHTDLPHRRLREVLIHHADLGLDGYTPEDWPADYVREELRRMEMVYTARQPMGATSLPELALQAPPLLRLRWLLGRAEIDGLQPAGIF